MKNNYLLLKIFSISVILLFVVISFRPDNISRLVSKRQASNSSIKPDEGQQNYFWRIKSNEKTNTLEIDDIMQARKQLAAMPHFKSSNSGWTFRGPDNIGGRTRALLIDKDNSTIMYAGGVAGGLWKSTTSGQYWEEVNYSGINDNDFNYLSVSSICQASNGDIYFGTGEGFLDTHGTNLTTPMINGSGIWKSTDGGQNFSKLASTWTTNDQKAIFILTFKLASDPTNPNLIYAATHKGLKVSNDGGESWQNASIESSGYDTKVCTDVKISTNGSVIASIDNACFLKKNGNSAFVKRSGSSNGLIDNVNVNRLEFAYAPTDPNYIYCITSDVNDQLNKIYVSRDGGDQWIVIGQGGSEFQPLDNQGRYSMAIAVFASDKDKVVIGGEDIWYGRKTSAGELFAWTQVSDYTGSNPIRYLHSDVHTIVFDLKNPKTFYIGSDGGVGRCVIDKNSEPFTLSVMNKNYCVTQFYSVAFNNKGQLFGGTQDNGSIMINGLGNTPKNGLIVKYSNEDVYPQGDGGYAAASSIVPSIVFSTRSYGGLYRNVDEKFADFQTFYSSNLINLYWARAGRYVRSPNQASFVTPIAYWETDNDPNNGEMIGIVCTEDYPADTTIYLDSRNIKFAKVKIVTDKDYLKGDSLYYHDPYSTLLALGLGRTVWITRAAARNEAIYDRDWWRGVKYNTLEEPDTNHLEKVTQIVISKDGNHLFFSTDKSRIFRISNLNQAYTEKQGSFSVDGSTNKPLTSVTKIGNFGARAITGISCDPNNPNNLIVTLGNYGNNNYVYLCNHATTANESTSMSHFIDITHNLPYAPVYCALIEQTTGIERVMVGTDLGVFMADHVMSQASSTITWSNYSEGFTSTPVFQIKQQTYDKADNNGYIYLATHGMGIWENSTYVGIKPTDPEANNFNNGNINVTVYPNPVSSELHIDYNLKENGSVKLDLINMNGKIVKTQMEGNQVKGEHKASILTNRLRPGTYLLRVSNGVSKKTVKIQKI
jgi:hypothetical protein